MTILHDVEVTAEHLGIGYRAVLYADANGGYRADIYRAGDWATEARLVDHCFYTDSVIVPEDALDALDDALESYLEANS